MEIIISEKGGAEKRQSFDTDEITLGRIQGNDITLPKGNVSKQHARLNLRDGVYYVTDQNSTNGTYVNRKRVTVPTAVAPGDRIYIGDYVLTIGGAEGAEAGDIANGGVAQQQHGALGGDLVPWPELDPPAKPAAVASPFLEPPDPAVVESPGLALKHPQQSLLDATPQAAPPSAVLAVPAEHAVANSPWAALCNATRIVVEATHQRFGLAVFQHHITAELNAEIDAFVAAAVQSMDVSVVANLGDSGRVSQLAKQELFELGPLGPVLGDATVTRIDIDGASSQWVSRLGQPARQELPFSTPASVVVALRRLCARAGIELLAHQRSVSGTLASGFRLSAIELPAQRILATLTRAGQIATSLESLQALGTLTSQAAAFLRACMQGRLNVLVVGARPSGGAPLLCALAQSAAVDAWTVIEAGNEFTFGASHRVRLDAEEIEGQQLALARLLRSRTLGRLLIEDMSGPAAALAFDSILAGADGVIAAVPASSIEQVMERLPLIAAGSVGSYPVEVARKVLANGFNVAAQLGHLKDGRDQLTRIAELQPRSGAEGVELVDIFRALTSATGEITGPCAAVGTPPTVAGLLRARGVAVDDSLFRRG
ncbi:MAG TPA: ATPase, T2SS/T4P/T4SS family [Polyangiaceae bacterium]|nr:ATPase, T2SS/T4P/T4SS family [Polyangiaceae bacterium]